MNDKDQHVSELQKRVDELNELKHSTSYNNYKLLNRDSENYEPSLLQMKELYRQTKPWTGKLIRLLLLLFLLHTHVSVYLYTYLTLITVAIAVTRRTRI